MAVSVSPLPASLGAVVTGVDVDSLDQKTTALLRQAWLDRLVLFFPEINLTNDQHMTLARIFGPHTASTTRSDGEDKRGLRTLAGDGYPDILVLDNDNNVADVWHTDVTFSSSPPIGSLLSMQVSPTGGDTMWINQYRAYDTLADPVKQLIGGPHRVARAAAADVHRQASGGAPASGHGACVPLCQPRMDLTHRRSLVH
jgi:taurine dioxygenase